MTIFKCKMCGGDIQVENNAVFGTCDSCGVTSTLPKANDDRLVNLFNRANHFRRMGEFDKALVVYENILNEEAANAEAHWGVVLCRYGIEYVEDPKTYQRVPTCHRTQHASVLSDADYMATLEYAPDSYTKDLYIAEANKINEIQKGILAISSKEKPYDVFICYKETTDGGSRTKDSTIAQDIYYQLDKEGYRVFFAKITLEDKLGQEYEPYIFNALNSAKVMLVIGTKAEHFNAVWVKNEWSRFLSIIKNDRSRLLIPCYRDMDAYDIPDELSHLQAQDMGKIGFLQDLVRGIKKIVDVNNVDDIDDIDDDSYDEYDDSAPSRDTMSENELARFKRGLIFLDDEQWEEAEAYFRSTSFIEHPENLIGQMAIEKRISFDAMKQLIVDNPLFETNVDDINQVSRYFAMFWGQLNLESGNYADADSYFDSVLDKHPEFGFAYVGKLKAEIGIAEFEELDDVSRFTKNLKEYKGYKNALRFSSPENREQLEKYNQSFIALRVEKRKAKELVLEQAAIALKEEAKKVAPKMEVYKKHSEWDDNNLCGYCGGALSMMAKCKDCNKTSEDWNIRGEPALVSKLGLGLYLLKQGSAWYGKGLCWYCGGGDFSSTDKTCKNCKRINKNWDRVAAYKARVYKLDCVYDSNGILTFQEIDKSKYVFRMAIKRKYYASGGEGTTVNGIIECGTINLNDRIDVFFAGKKVMSKTANAIHTSNPNWKSVNSASEGQEVSIDIFANHTKMEDNCVLQIVREPGEEQELIREQEEQKKLEKEKRAEPAKIKIIEDERNMLAYNVHVNWRNNGLCGFCGGKLSLLGKCKQCGKKGGYALPAYDCWDRHWKYERIKELNLGMLFIQRIRNSYENGDCYFCGSKLQDTGKGTKVCKKSDCSRYNLSWPEIERKLSDLYGVEYNLGFTSKDYHNAWLSHESNNLNK